MPKNKREPVTLNSEEKVTSEEEKKVKINAVKWNPDEYPKENQYYSAIASKYKAAKLILILILIIYLITAVTVFRNDITIENLQYLLKDLDFSSIKNKNDYSTIIYDSAANSEFAFYRDDLVVAREGSATVYSINGSVVFSSSNNMYSPRLLSSKKYFLIYDFGDMSCSYTLYNSFSELKTVKTDYPITAAALSDTGMYAIVSRDINYRGIVEVFDEKFNAICKISKDKYIMDVNFGIDGKELIVLSAYVVDGNWQSEIMICDPYTGKERALKNIENEMPIKADYTDNGGFVVTTDSGFYFYNSDAALYSKYLFDGVMPVYNDIFSDAVIAAFNKTVLGNEKIVRIFDENGDEIFSTVVSGQIKKSVKIDDMIYILSENSLNVIDLSSSSMSEKKIDGNCLDILATSSGKIMLCYPGSAYLLNWDETQESGTVSE